VDVIGDARADRYSIAISEAMKDENVDATFVILTPQSMTDINTIASEVVTVSRRFDKPIYASFMGAADVAPVNILQRSGFPTTSCRSPCAARSPVLAFPRAAPRPHPRWHRIPAGPGRRPAVLDRALRRAGLPDGSRRGQCPGRIRLSRHASHVARSPEEAAKCAADVGFPRS
jgi:acetyltransferase